MKNLKNNFYVYLHKRKDNIKVGCMEGTRREDWEKVYKLLK